eukprot:scaffold29169_cov38-Tisochrysis_lutea.AAC.1
MPDEPGVRVIPGGGGAGYMCNSREIGHGPISISVVTCNTSAAKQCNSQGLEGSLLWANHRPWLPRARLGPMLVQLSRSAAVPRACRLPPLRDSGREMATRYAPRPRLVPAS